MRERCKAISALPRERGGRGFFCQRPCGSIKHLDPRVRGEERKGDTMALDLETRNQLIDTVRRFVAERLRPLEAQVAENDAVPDDVIAEMRELGLYGLSIPEEYGGLDLSMEDECLVAVELGRTSPAFRSAFGTNVGIGSQGLVMFGTDAQKQKYLPGIASGEIITSFAL